MTVTADRTSAAVSIGPIVVSIVTGVVAAGIAAYVLGLLVLAGVTGEVTTPSTRLLSALGVFVVVGVLVFVGTRARVFALTAGAALLGLSIVILSLPAPSFGADSSLFGAIAAGCQILLVPAVAAALLALGLVRGLNRK